MFKKNIKQCITKVVWDDTRTGSPGQARGRRGEEDIILCVIPAKAGIQEIFTKILCAVTLLLYSFSINSWQCDLASLSELMATNNQIKYQECSDIIPFNYERLPVTDNHYLHPYQGFFHKTFILHITQAQLFGMDGWVFVDDKLIYDLTWQNVFLPKYFWEQAKQNLPTLSFGKVAVIAQSGYPYYYHWLVEVLGRLALLELNGAEYDFVYAPMDKSYMKEAMQLWGIDSAKIIAASDNCIIQADELIVPSLVSKVHTNGCPRLSHYTPEYILSHIRNKLLTAANKQETNFQGCKKVFISRKDAGSRKMLNEDEVFELFKAAGFQRYILSDLSLVEQIKLFNNAEIIVGALGSGMANVIFCNDKVQVVDIFQARRDTTIYYLCQTFGFSYRCVKTMEFIDANDGQYDSTVPLQIIQDLIDTLQ
ncbi:MAG TPA: glycosyltransferase family 61 protein [Candidatus Saccharimonadales bacterium]|nr:glycosyltransferase family 61 protein [Candidatus Saccharimonadales bacterium]